MPPFLNSLICLVFLFYFEETPSFAQKKLIVKDLETGRTRSVKKEKALGVVTLQGDTLIRHSDHFSGKDIGTLVALTDSSLGIKTTPSGDIRTFRFRDIKYISFQRAENAGSSHHNGKGIAGLLLSPLLGIQPGHKYNWTPALVGLSAIAIFVGIELWRDHLTDWNAYSIAGAR